VGVSASSSSCTWTATSNASWLTVTSGGNSTGDGSVGFTIAANPNTATRMGTLTIAGFDVHDYANGGSRVSVTFGSAQVSVPASGGKAENVTVTTNAPDFALDSNVECSLAYYHVRHIRDRLRYGGPGQRLANTGALRTATITIAGQSGDIHAKQRQRRPRMHSSPMSGRTQRI